MEITINVKNKIASEIDSTPIVCNNTNYRVNFILDDEWSFCDLEKLSVYYTIDNEMQEILPMRQDANGYYINLPVITTGNISLFGIKYNDISTALYTTSSACVKIINSIDKYNNRIDEYPYGYAVNYTNGQLELQKYAGTAAQQTIETVTFPVNFGIDNQSGKLYYSYEMGPQYYRNVLNAWALDIDSEILYSKSIPANAQWDSIDSIGGRSVVANQCYKRLSVGTQTKAGITLTLYTDGLMTATGTKTSEQVDMNIYIFGSNFSTAGHKYYVRSGDDNIKILFYNTTMWDAGGRSVSQIVTANSEQNFTTGVSINITDVVPGTTLNVSAYPAIVDLTAWFGAGNEPTLTTDPKMSEVYAYLEAHPEYNAGIVVHGAVTSVEVKDADAVVIKTEQIPAAVQALTGYGQSNGTSVNYIDFGEKKYHCFGSYVDGSWVAQTETITDVSDLLTDGFLENIPVESNGSIIFKQNSTQLQVPIINNFITTRNEQ